MATLRAGRDPYCMLLGLWPSLLYGNTPGRSLVACYGYVSSLKTSLVRMELKINLLIPKNVLGGALFSPFYATILLTTLTTIGSLCATLLSTPLGPFLANLFPRALDMTRNALGGDTDKDHPDTPGSGPKPKSSPWVRLSVLRLIGVVPWSGINIACGVCGVSLVDCMLGTFIGCLPWTAVTCQVCYF